MKIAIVEQNRGAIEAVFAIANGESQVNTADMSSALLAMVSAESILDVLGIPLDMREGAKAQYIEGEAGEPTTYFNIERGGDIWFLVSADRLQWNGSRQGTKVYELTEPQGRIALENGFDRWQQDMDEKHAQAVQAAAARPTEISQCLPEIAEYLTRTCGIEIDEEQADRLIATDPDLRDEIADWGGIDDIEFSMRLLDLMAQTFLDRNWPAEEEGIDPEEFLFDLRTAAAQQGFTLTRTCETKPSYRFET